MEENIKDKEIKLKLLYKISIYFGLLLIVFLLVQGSLQGSVLATDETDEFCYLSDIPYVESQTRVGWGQLGIDKASDNSLISVKVEGAYYTFEKGIFAHATSTVVYDLTNYDYDFFTAYIGLNKTAASSSNGVKFFIYTSQDGTTWNLKTAEEPSVMKAGANAEFVKVDIKDAKFLKLYADSNGANGNDHSVYADAKLIKETYKEEGESLVPTVEEFDEEIKTKFPNADLTNKEFELKLLQRELVKRAGNYALRRFLSESQENKDTYLWLTSDVENLRLYILGGAPEGGSYYNSLTQLSRLYNEYSSDFTKNVLLNNEWCPEGMTNGDLYKKMAITLSLTHSQNVGLWMQSGAAENKSDALKRYAIYKYMYENGKFDASTLGSIWDITKWFESLQVEEMRFVMNNAIDDEEIIWLNAYVQDRVTQYRQSGYLTPHPYMAYVWPSYGNPVYYDPNNVDYFNELFAINKKADNLGQELVDENGEKTGKVGLFDTKFTIPGGKNNPSYTISVTRGTSDYKLYKVWMNFRNKFGTGAVCGGISKSGSNIRTTHGIPATVIGQPGHAALLYYTKNTQGKGYWGIDNDVSGWTLSEKGERLLMGWGNAGTNYARGSYQVVYMVLAQEALNDYENFEKCEEQVMLADVYKNDLAKKEEIYRKALDVQDINIDAWLGLINVYLANENKTENDFYDLAKELAEDLKCFPLPMYHLTNLIKPKLTSVENTYKFTLLQTRILTEGSKLPNTATDEVLQPSVTRTEANYLLGKLDKTIATFSFDGEDAGKIVLSSRFDGNGVRWDYSLDGKKTWNEVSFTGEEEHKLQLTQRQIASITAENDIYIHIVGVNYDEENLYKIDIVEQGLPANLFANDLENRVVGVSLNTEWRYTDKDAWTSYSKKSPDLTGDKTVQVREAASGTKLTSDVATYTFTEDNQPDTRKYIPVSHLSIQSVSTQATNNGGAATNAIDANYNTRWHSAWNGTDTQRFIVVKLDRSVCLSAVEFVPAGGGNGKIYDGTIYGSMDGENWEKLAERKNITYTNQANTNQDAIANTKSFEIAEPKEVQYVKIVADRTNGNWFAARAFNFYQDLTKNPHPTAGVAYSPTEKTNGYVVARLINPSTKITITNNDGKDTYIFKENGEFTFEFEDEKGNKGSSVAKVNWIDKDIPTADVKYELDADNKLLILLDNISEDVYLLDENNNKINYIEVEDGKVSRVTYLDHSGNGYKTVEMDKDGVINKIIYKNTTGKVSSVSEYVTIIENGTVSSEEYIDSEGNSVTVTDSEKQTLRGLRQAISNPLEYVLDKDGNHEFKLLDKANNIAYKSIKADYIENDTKILASDISYDITKKTNKEVVATINPYIIDTSGKKANVKIVNNSGVNTHKFTKNGEFTFAYKDASDTEDLEIKEHTAKVNWIDKTPPTAEIKYSTEEVTDGEVIASLVNESETIFITNNGADREYTFTKNGEFIFEFEDIAGNKATLVAKVDWIKEESEDPDNPEKPDDPNKPEEPDNPEKPEVKDKITSEKYKIEENYISKVLPNTTVSSFKQNVKADKDIVMNKTDDEIVETGTKVKVGDTEYTVIVIGDIDGNGKITIKDLSNMKLHLINKKLLTGIYLQAADINEDGEVSLIDLSQLKLILIDKLEIK